MDADYRRIRDKDGNRIDRDEWKNALFILTQMSHAKPDRAICDAGLKVLSVDIGLPVFHGRDDVRYIDCSDEHGVIEDKRGVLRLNEKLKLNLHNWYVGTRNGEVKFVWPGSARGKSY